jgi:hypothetical protein
MCFKGNIVYNAFTLIGSYVGFISEQNGMNFKLNSKSIQLLSNKKEQRSYLSRKRVIRVFFTCFSSKIF